MKTIDLLAAYDWDKFERVIALSPHLDDAVLSTAGLLTALKGKVSRLVVTIACGNPVPRNNNGSGRHRRGFASPLARRREDIRAMHDLDCDFVHLGFADCIYRRSPTTGDLIYRRSRTKFALCAPDDSAYVEELFLVLRRLVQNMGRVLVLAPMGIGLHVDHAICAQVALQVASPNNLLFYEDVPYVFDHEFGGGEPDDPTRALERIGCRPSARLAVHTDVATKVRLVKHYATQLSLFFGPDRSLEPQLANVTWKGSPAEFYWRARPHVTPPERGGPR
ncbi:MAG: PIG-L family deacetylase [Deltaproteobacteria bacterium]|jgi:LmbE family N-acetylglucosaminyl deacetylase